MKALLHAAVLAVVVRGNDVTTPGCIEPGQEIVVGFELDSNRAGDWVGLYPAGSTTGEPRGENWVWTCGTQGCGHFPQVGPIAMPSPNFAGSAMWVAVVVRWEIGKLAPYDVVETSAPFFVKNDCSTVSRPVSCTRLSTAHSSFFSLLVSISPLHLYGCIIEPISRC
jgi:hypothetical protein